MRKVCAWCQKDIDPEDSAPVGSDAPISHGICPDCVPKFLSFLGKPMREFLDEFSGPVFLVDATNKVITGNSNGLALVGRVPEAIEEKKIGDVFECPHASEAEGCGETTHCKSCTIRSAIAETSRTGEARLRIPAYADLHSFSKTKKTKFSISTEKVGDVVLLRIDDIA